MGGREDRRKERKGRKIRERWREQERQEGKDKAPKTGVFSIIIIIMPLLHWRGGGIGLIKEMNFRVRLHLGSSLTPPMTIIMMS